MNASTRLYGWMKVLAVLHIVEQLMFGMQDLDVLKRMLVRYDGRFRNADTATEVLVLVSTAIAILTIYCILRGGSARLVALIILGLPAIGELHHLVDSAHAGHYRSGTVTAVPSVLCGLLFLRALVKEYRTDKANDAPTLLRAAVARKTAGTLCA